MDGDVGNTEQEEKEEEEGLVVEAKDEDVVNWEALDRCSQLAALFCAHGRSLLRSVFDAIGHLFFVLQWLRG